MDILHWESHARSPWGIPLLRTVEKPLPQDRMGWKWNNFTLVTGCWASNTFSSPNSGKGSAHTPTPWLETFTNPWLAELISQPPQKHRGPWESVFHTHKTFWVLVAGSEDCTLWILPPHTRKFCYSMIGTPYLIRKKGIRYIFWGDDRYFLWFLTTGSPSLRFDLDLPGSLPANRLPEGLKLR